MTACYENSLKLAKEHGLKTIAFPLISAGVYGYPQREAIKVAVETMKGYAEDFEEIPPQEFELSDPMLDAVEKEDKFVIIVKRATIYVLPKRCMDDEMQGLIRDKLRTVNL